MPVLTQGPTKHASGISALRKRTRYLWLFGLTADHYGVVGSYVSPVFNPQHRQRGGCFGLSVRAPGRPAAPMKPSGASGPEAEGQQRIAPQIGFTAGATSPRRRSN